MSHAFSPMKMMYWMLFGILVRFISNGESKIFIGDCAFKYCDQLCKRIGFDFMECACNAGYNLHINGRTCELSQQFNMVSSEDEEEDFGSYSGNYKTMTTNCDNEDGDCEDVVVKTKSGGGEGSGNEIYNVEGSANGMNSVETSVNEIVSFEGSGNQVVNVDGSVNQTINVKGAGSENNSLEVSNDKNDALNLSIIHKLYPSSSIKYINNLVTNLTESNVALPIRFNSTHFANKACSPMSGQLTLMNTPIVNASVNNFVHNSTQASSNPVQNTNGIKMSNKVEIESSVKHSITKSMSTQPLARSFYLMPKHMLHVTQSSSNSSNVLQTTEGPKKASVKNIISTSTKIKTLSPSEFTQRLHPLPSSMFTLDIPIIVSRQNQKNSKRFSSTEFPSNHQPLISSNNSLQKSLLAINYFNNHKSTILDYSSKRKREFNIRNSDSYKDAVDSSKVDINNILSLIQKSTNLMTMKTVSAKKIKMEKSRAITELSNTARNVNIKPSQNSISQSSHVLDIKPLQSSHVLDVKPLQSSHVYDIKPLQSSHVLDTKPLQSSHVLDIKPTQSSHVLDIKPTQSSHVLDIKPTQSSHVSDIKTLQSSRYFGIEPSKSHNHLSIQPSSRPHLYLSKTTLTSELFLQTQQNFGTSTIINESTPSSIKEVLKSSNKTSVVKSNSDTTTVAFKPNMIRSSWSTKLQSFSVYKETGNRSRSLHYTLKIIPSEVKKSYSSKISKYKVTPALQVDQNVSTKTIDFNNKLMSPILESRVTKQLNNSFIDSVRETSQSGYINNTGTYFLSTTSSPVPTTVIIKQNSGSHGTFLMSNVVSMIILSGCSFYMIV